MKHHSMPVRFGNGMRKKKRKKTLRFTCEICTKTFKPKVNNQKSCSPECSQILKYLRAARFRDAHRAALVEKPCVQCKELFQPTRRDHKFCSVKCSNASRSRAVILPPIPCQECGKDFIPRNRLAKVCSSECRYIYEKRREVIRGKIKRMPFSIPEKKCAACNCIFKPKSTAQKYCSGSCNADASKARERILQNSQPIRKRKCLHCTEFFTPPTRKSMAKFCGQACRNRYQATQRQVEKAALEKEQQNLEKLQKKWDKASVQVKECPVDSAYQQEIWEYLKKGKTITKYMNPIWVRGSVVDVFDEDQIDIEDL